MPPCPITDSQIHLWEADVPGQQRWEAGAVPDLAEPLTATRFLAMMDEVGVARAIISPPGIHGFDPGYALQCAQQYPDRYAVVSRWTLDDPDSWARLPTWLDQPGMLGLRISLTAANVAKWSESGALPRFFAEAAAADIPLMLFTTGDLTAVEDAARAHPHLRLVVDHANLVASTRETMPARIDALLALAGYNNVGVKLGALPTRSAGGYPYDDIHDVIRSLYRAFGASRLMWASDLTTTLRGEKGSYRESLDLIRVAALGSVPAAEMEAILGGTVSTWFDWPW